MASHRRPGKRPQAGFRGLLRSYRDQVVLAVCFIGLLAAWLVYGMSAAPSPATLSHGVTIGNALPDPAEHQVVSPGGSQGQPTPKDLAPTATARAGEPAAPLAVGGAPLSPPPPSFPAASPPQRITYPAAGMDVVVHPLEPDAGDTEAQSIVPPETMDGYWLKPFGTPGSGSVNTTYVIGHSWLDRDAPFNHLSSGAAAGDEFKVTTATGEMTYKVESVTTHTKTTLKDSPIWAVVPNQLVLISCYTEDPWGMNVTVVASPVPGR